MSEQRTHSAVTSSEQFKDSLGRIYRQDDFLNKLKLSEILEPVPRIDKLNLPHGSRVIIRCDLDVPLKDGRVADDSRLMAILPTIEYAVKQGWAPVLMGHLGRDPENSLAPVALHLGKALCQDITFLSDWIDEKTGKLEANFCAEIGNLSAGQVVMLENTRKYAFERVMWKLPPAEFDSVSETLYKLASELYEHVSHTLVNESLAASNFDFSSAVLPLVMEHVAYGFYISKELAEHVSGARQSSLVIFSGLKIDKLNDLEEIIKLGNLRMIIAAGSLAMALRKARAELDGTAFGLGLAEEDESAKFFIARERIEQAKAMLTECDIQAIDVVLPLDFVLDDGTISETIPPGQAQLDIGPKTRELFSQKLQEFAKSGGSPALFYNGVFGKFEDERFAGGTRAFIAALKQATDSGVKTYVGGGEGRMALIKYGKLEDVTHAFTAGGTILKSLGARHIAYVKANYLQSKFIAETKK